ncbi:MAG TPA: hypothetical protein PL196_10835, partial [Burkholderiaceae bacterium]|nr:hypothetical protein [Burkholderiaceae bacterium]
MTAAEHDDLAARPTPNEPCAARTRIPAGERPARRIPLPWAPDASSNFVIDMEAMRELPARCGFVAEYFEDVSRQPWSVPADDTTESAPQAPLSLSACVDDLALKANNATRRLKEREIRLVRGVF